MQYGKVDPATCECVKYCPEATPPKTNADRIRGMSDGELAEWLVFVEQRILERQPILERPALFADWLDWLKEEV